MYDDMPQLVDATLGPLQTDGGFPGQSGVFGGPSIPPPPGATYSGGAGTFGPGSFGNSSNGWENQIDYSSGEYIRNELCIFCLFSSSGGRISSTSHQQLSSQGTYDPRTFESMAIYTFFTLRTIFYGIHIGFWPQPPRSTATTNNVHTSFPILLCPSAIMGASFSIPQFYFSNISI